MVRPGGDGGRYEIASKWRWLVWCLVTAGSVECPRGADSADNAGNGAKSHDAWSSDEAGAGR